MLIPMIIKGDLWHFLFRFVLLLAIYSESVVQKCPTELCKSHQKIFEMDGVLLKKSQVAT